MDDHQGFVAGKEESSLGAGAALGGARGARSGARSGRGTCAWRGRAPPRTSASRRAGLPSLRARTAARYKGDQRPRVRIPPPARVSREGL